MTQEATVYLIEESILEELEKSSDTSIEKMLTTHEIYLITKNSLSTEERKKKQKEFSTEIHDFLDETMSFPEIFSTIRFSEPRQVIYFTASQEKALLAECFEISSCFYNTGNNDYYDVSVSFEMRSPMKTFRKEKMQKTQK